MHKRSALYDFHKYDGSTKSMSYKSEVNTVYGSLVSVFLATSAALYMTEHYQSLIDDTSMVYDSTSERFSGTYSVFVLTTSIVMGIMVFVAMLMMWHNFKTYKTGSPGDRRTISTTSVSLIIAFTTAIMNVLFIENSQPSDLVVERNRLRGTTGGTLLGLNISSLALASISSVFLYVHKLGLPNTETSNK